MNENRNLAKEFVIRHKGDLDETLEGMLHCNVACAGDFHPHHRRKWIDEELIDWYYHNLPGVDYVVDNIVNLIFSNGLTTGDEKQDEKLDDFLYSKNAEGITNKSIIIAAVKEMLIYGKCGLRKLSKEDGVVLVKSANYGSIREYNEEHKGFKQTIGYAVSTNCEKMWDIDLEALNIDYQQFLKDGTLLARDQQNNERVIILSKDEMLNLRNDITQEHGESPFKRDRLRVKMLETLYERIVYDLEYDGLGRIVLRLKNGYNLDSVSGTNETSAILDTTEEAKKERLYDAQEQAKALARQLKSAGPESVIIIGGDYADNIERYPRQVDAKDYSFYIQDTKDVEIMGQIFDVPSVLIDVGSTNGNISQESKIDQAMQNAVVPMRERIALQLSSFLADWIGVDKIYFDKYEMKQAVNENERRGEIVDQITKLRATGNAQDEELANVLAGSLINEIDREGGVDAQLSTKGNKQNKIKKRINGLFRRNRNG